MPTVNERVIYRAMAGDCWDATVLAVNKAEVCDLEFCDWIVDLSVMGPGMDDPVVFHNIPWFDDPNDPVLAHAGYGAIPRG